MASFKPLSTSNFDPFFGPKSTADNTYWSRFKFPVTVKEYGPVSYIDFSPNRDSQQFAVSASTKVQIYSTVTSQITKTLSKFHSTAHGGSFRKDGKLLVAGGEEGRVRVYDVESNALLRAIHGHSLPIHLCKFTIDSLHVVSFSDDKKMIVWDIPGECPVLTYKEHTDYVRTGAVSKSSNNIILSGSYDHSVKLFDTRTAQSVLSVDHGSPVESVLIFPSGGIFVSAGGPEVRVWDVCGGRLLAKVSQHHKTITCMTFASGYSKLLSGSLDKHVKVYDVNTYHVVHTLDFPSPILSIGIAPNDSTLAVGMSDGLLSIQTKSDGPIEPSGFQGAISSKFDMKNTSFKQVEDGTIYVRHNETEKMAPHDRLLRQYEASKALSHGLRHHINNKPEVAMALIQELIRRGSIKAAVAGRNDLELQGLLTFLLKHIGNPAFSRLMVDFANIVFDAYGTSIITSTRTAALFNKARNKVNREIECMKEMMALNGTIELLLAASNAKNFSDIIDEASAVT